MFIRLADWVDRSCSRDQYEELRTIIVQAHPDVWLPNLRRRDDRLTKMTGIESRSIDCCINNCIAFTGKYSDHAFCPIQKCEQPRWRDYNADTGEHGNAFKTYEYIPLIPRLQLQYRSRRRAHTLQTYNRQFRVPGISNDITDWWAGSRYQELRRSNYFTEPTDIALSLLLDGVQVTNRQNYASNPVILMNYNLPPRIRQQQQNILLSFVIPGPRKHKDLDSFLFLMAAYNEGLSAL